MPEIPRILKKKQTNKQTPSKPIYLISGTTCNSEITFLFQIFLQGQESLFQIFDQELSDSQASSFFRSTLRHLWRKLQGKDQTVVRCGTALLRIRSGLRQNTCSGLFAYTVRNSNVKV